MRSNWSCFVDFVLNVRTMNCVWILVNRQSQHVKVHTQCTHDTCTYTNTYTHTHTTHTHTHTHTHTPHTCTPHVHTFIRRLSIMTNVLYSDTHAHDAWYTVCCNYHHWRPIHLYIAEPLICCRLPTVPLYTCTGWSATTVSATATSDMVSSQWNIDTWP